MTHDFPPQFETLLQLAALVRKDHELAQERARNSDANPYPAALRPYVQKVKELVGDWQAREAAQTYYTPVKATMQAWLVRAVAIFPAKLTIDEAQAIFAAQPKEADEAPFIACEVRRFWQELDGVSDLLEMRLLSIKYDLTFNNQ
jgi:hypothetical protein